MKKQVFFAVLFLFAIFSVFIVSAANETTTCDANDEDCKVNNAYICLNQKISDKTCNDLSSEERLFSFLATGKCKNQVLDDSKYESDLKFTSIAAIGMHNSGSDTSDVEDWLKSQERNSIGLDWFLEIESSQATSCTIKYSSSNNVNIDENKKITSITGGTCLTLAQDGYWLKVNPNCYDENFTVSCDQGFLTTLLYQRQGSDTVYISETTHSSSSQGETEENVKSLCFKSGSSCDYEGSLWASLALSVTGNEANFYLPYLITFAEDNENLLPESVLYFLTGNSDFKNQLLSKQINNKWWVSLSDRFYGTALALYPLKYEDSSQKDGAKDWLLNEVQNDDGCWDSGNLKSTGFILASIWPRGLASNESGQSNLVDCESAGYSCTSRINCNGESLSNYYCSGTFVCCSQPPVLDTCFEQGGEICNSNQQCAGVGAVKADAAGLSLGQVCCVGGSCQDASAGGTVSQCESSGGTCRVNGCLNSEDEVFELGCDFSSDVCCVQKSTSSTSGSSLWIWILLILIVLVVLGIIFRDKLREWWIRIKSKSNRKGPGNYPGIPPRRLPMRRGGFPLVGGRPNATMAQRRAITPSKSSPKGSSELDDVLKKLKEIGK